MKVKIERSRLVKPLYQSTPPPTSSYTPLSVFDKVTYNQHIAVIYAYRPPTPSNVTIELGLQKALGIYREWGGRLGHDNDGNLILFLNDKGVRFVEASVDSELDQTVLLKPCSSLLSLHPKLKDVVELVQVQLTTFSCGSLVVGFTAHHLVADGHASSNFLVAWGQATRGIDITPLPFCNRTIFSPRNPPKFELEHKGAEYVTKNFKRVYPLIHEDMEDIVVHKVHYTAEFLAKLKKKASSMNENKYYKPFSTFESLVAHLWRTITKARGLNQQDFTQVRISIDGRSRINPKVLDEYFGNLVLWAFPRAKVHDLLCHPLSYAAKLIHVAIVKVNDDYFKSFIDFSCHKAKEEQLLANTQPNTTFLWPNLEVDSWLRFPFYDLDFGQGGPCIFMPSFFATEGMLFLVPYFTGDGSIEAFVPLYQQNLATFQHFAILSIRYKINRILASSFFD